MSPIMHPRHLCHRGTVTAAGFLFAPEVIREEAARRRILEEWEPGSRVYRTAEGLLLELEQPRRVVAETATGAPLTRQGGWLVAMPLTAAERAALGPGGGVALCREGTLRVVPLGEWTELDPAAWLDLREWDVLTAETIPVNTVVRHEPPAREIRDILESVPPPDPQLVQVLAELRSGKPGRERKGFLLGWLARLTGEERTGATGAARGTGANNPGPLGKPGLGNRLLQSLAASTLNRYLYQKHQQYMERTLELFDRGNLLEALRHAIPLSNLPPEAENGRPFLGFLRPRSNLTIRPPGGGGFSSLAAGPDFYEHLRRVYRMAGERLEREGRLREAAYVLAELLNQGEEAAALLERHGMLREAAELAETRSLSAALVVRLWWLAGERTRALTHACRTGAFAEAVSLCERQGEPATDLRLAWAEVLAAAGEPLLALEAAWPIRSAARERLREWLGEAGAPDGPTGGRLLVRKLLLVPEAAQETRCTLETLLEADEPEHAATRWAVGAELAECDRTSHHPALARQAVRSLLRDQESARLPIHRDLIRDLLVISQDALLRTDLPAFIAQSGSRLERGTPREWTFEADDRGTMAAADAVMLPDGRLLAALGEAGVRLLTRDGRTAAVFPQPAETLIPSDSGGQALLLSPRGELQRISRLNLCSQQAQHWADLPLTCWEPTFDGLRWFVAQERELLLLDVRDEVPRGLWRTPDLPGPCRLLRRQAQQLVALLGIPPTAEEYLEALKEAPLHFWSWQSWMFSLPDPRLRYRPEIAQHGTYLKRWWPMGWIASSPDKLWQVAFPWETPEGRPSLLMPHGEASYTSTVEGGRFWQGAGADPWIALAFRMEGEVRVEVLRLDRYQADCRATLMLQGSQSCRLRLSAQELTVADDRGRLVVLDLNRGELRRNLRLGPG